MGNTMTAVRPHHDILVVETVVVVVKVACMAEQQRGGWGVAEAGVVGGREGEGAEEGLVGEGGEGVALDSVLLLRSGCGSITNGRRS